MEKIFKPTLVHASVIYQIPWIRRISFPFRENSIVSPRLNDSITVYFCLLKSTQIYAHMWVMVNHEFLRIGKQFTLMVQTDLVQTRIIWSWRNRRVRITLHGQNYKLFLAKKPIEFSLN